MEIIYTSEAQGYLRINRPGGPRLGTILQMSQDGSVWGDIIGTQSGRPGTPTSISQDGCWLLFVIIMGKDDETALYEPGNPGLAVAEIDGNPPRRRVIIPGALAGAWGPDSQSVVFYRSARRGGQAGIFLYDVEQHTETLIYTHPSLQDEMDGTLEVVTPRFAWLGNDKLLFGYGPLALDKSIVSVSIADGAVAVVGDGWDPAVSPSLEQFAFVRDNQLLISGLDGVNERVVFASPEAKLLRWPSWSPDGTQLVFEAYFGDDGEIFKIDVTGENLTQLTQNDYWDGRPEWRSKPEQCAAFPRSTE
jgi:hypothetical protein